MTLTKEIYRKPTFTVAIAGREYQGIVKIQRKFGKTLRRFMVHGIEMATTNEFDVSFKEAVDHLKRDYGKGRGDIFFQVWIYNALDHRTTKLLTTPQAVEEITKKRQYQQADFRQRYDLRPSRREHMPNATLLLDLTRDLDLLRADVSDSCRRSINKSSKAWLLFERADTKDEREAYRDVRYALSFDKGFSVVPKETFLLLMEYISSHQAGALRLAKKDKNIVSGAVYLFQEDTLLYVYWATDRSFGHLWAQYRLTREILKRAKENDYKTLDLLGIAPTWADVSHHLTGVTRFKQSFWGTTVNYVGNYDVVFNTLLYKTRTLLKK